MSPRPEADAAGDSELRFAHYRVLRRPDGSTWELGRGAMGVTYKAFDERLRIEVALKLITPGQVDNPKTQALFLREARGAPRVRHANVASVVFLNDTPGNFFYAMEFIAGKSLQEWLRTRGTLPIGLAIGLATQVARGLSAIHEQHIVHRELKPANLMIVAAGQQKTRADSDSNPDAWQVKIIDFGLARGFTGEGLGTEVNAQTVGFRGTALYASPEQCEERGQLDGRSDLYSLGCILWEMLLGAPPFRARTHRELRNQHVSQAAPLERIARLPASLQVVLTQLLAKNPDHRFADTDAVVLALEQCRGRLTTGEEKLEDVDRTIPHAAPVAAPTPAGQRRRDRAGRGRFFSRAQPRPFCWSGPDGFSGAASRPPPRRQRPPRRRRQCRRRRLPARRVKRLPCCHFSISARTRTTNISPTAFTRTSCRICPRSATCG